MINLIVFILNVFIFMDAGGCQVADQVSVQPTNGVCICLFLCLLLACCYLIIRINCLSFECINFYGAADGTFLLVGLSFGGLVFLLCISSALCRWS